MTDQQPLTETQRIGRRIAALRKAQGLSQRALAEKAGVGQTQVVNTEKGHNSPNVETLAKMLDAMGCKLAIVPQETTPIY